MGTLDFGTGGSEPSCFAVAEHGWCLVRWAFVERWMSTRAPNFGMGNSIIDAMQCCIIGTLIMRSSHRDDA